MSKFLFFIVILCFVQSAAAQKQYKIIYNVLEDREKDNYEIYSMNMDRTGQKKSPTLRMCSGFIVPTKTNCTTSAIKTPVTVVIFCMKWMQRETIKEKFLTCN
jgi:hypothetical protein